MISLTITYQEYQVDAAQDEPLLWVIRDRLGFTGTKFGCGIGEKGNYSRCLYSFGERCFNKG
jgi:aerobic-type carbon monoxide dehydrogenase small subunit (CoxS/CutS family)